MIKKLMRTVGIIVVLMVLGLVTSSITKEEVFGKTNENCRFGYETIVGCKLMERCSANCIVANEAVELLNATDMNHSYYIKMKNKTIGAFIYRENVMNENVEYFQYINTGNRDEICSIVQKYYDDVEKYSL